MTTLPESFHSLARYLAWNHIYLSVRSEDFSNASRRFLQEQASLPPKIVAIVGAGASNDACNLPTGEKAAQRLIEIFKRKTGINDRLIEEEIHRITVEYRLGRGDFEAVLLALSKFDQRTVLDELNAMYSRRHYPSLTYELLSHWLKHRFIDAIVNFNFDELLDQAIDDELGPRGYYRVISDGDCPERIDLWQDSRKRFHFPLYIKPHGTASHKSTMRFTRSAYSLLPSDLVKLLAALFKDQVEIIIIGHAMQSVEFNDILLQASDQCRTNLHFYSIGHEKPELKVYCPEWDPEFWNSHAGLGHCMDLLSTTAATLFRPGLQPRSVCRHQLIASLFNRKVALDEEKAATDDQEIAYLRDRVYVEISLAISKAKGFVSLEHLARGRAGQYFRSLRKHIKAGSQDSMLSMCSDLNLKEFGYSRDTLCLPVSEAQASRDRVERPILRESEFEDSARDLARRTRTCLRAERQKQFADDFPQLYSTFMQMYRGEEVEVSSEIGATTNDVFSNPVVLPTLTSLYAQTDKMIKQTDWDSILCIAESGKWILQKEWIEQIRKRQASLAIVVADMAHSGDIKEEFGENLAGIRWLPWWLHNRHVTALVYERRVTQAIFFERRLRTSHISPLWLKDTDAEIAKDAFVAYWIKADQYLKHGNDIAIQREHLQAEWHRLSDEMLRQHQLRRPIEEPH